MYWHGFLDGVGYTCLIEAVVFITTIVICLKMEKNRNKF